MDERNLDEVRTLAQKAASDAGRALHLASTMSPLDNVQHAEGLVVAIWAAHALRCLEKAGLLDDEARASIQHQLAFLSQAADEVPQHDLQSYGVLAHLDLLARTLPPPKSGDS